MIYKPNTPYYAEFITSSPNTGGVKNADSLPIAVATKNGTDDSSFSLTVTNIDTGRYKITGNIPAGYVAGDSVQISVSATVDGVADKLVVHNFLVDTKRTSDLKDFDYLNQACILTSDYDAAKSAASQSSVNAIPTNPLLTEDVRLNNINAPIGSIPINPLLTNDTRLNNLDATISSRHTLGVGAITWAYTLTNSSTGHPIADADIWVTTDTDGMNIIASGRTNQVGVVTFYLDAGTIYVWRQKSGYNFMNPDVEVVA